MTMLEPSEVGIEICRGGSKLGSPPPQLRHYRLHWRKYHLKLYKPLRKSSCSERLKWILNETPRKKIIKKIKVQKSMSERSQNGQIVT